MKIRSTPSSSKVTIPSFAALVVQFGRSWPAGPPRPSHLFDRELLRFFFSFGFGNALIANFVDLTLQNGSLALAAHGDLQIVNGR